MLYLFLHYEDIIEDSILEINSDVNYVDIITKSDKKIEEENNQNKENIIEIIDCSKRAIK